MRFRTHSEADTLQFGAALGALLSPGDALLLSGDLGVGKSVVARGVARALGISGAMPSPTFALMMPYEGAHTLYHMDLYRLSGPDELYAAGLDECIGGDGIAVVEWPETVGLAPERAVRLRIARARAENEREILMEVSGMALDAAALTHWRANA